MLPVRVLYSMKWFFSWQSRLLTLTDCHRVEVNPTTASCSGQCRVWSVAGCLSLSLLLLLSVTYPSCDSDTLHYVCNLQGTLEQLEQRILLVIITYSLFSSAGVSGVVIVIYVTHMYIYQCDRLTGILSELCVCSLGCSVRDSFDPYRCIHVIV